jgi:hypothetical protein
MSGVVHIGSMCQNTSLLPTLNSIFMYTPHTQVVYVKYVYTFKPVYKYSLHVQIKYSVGGFFKRHKDYLSVKHTQDSNLTVID